ncbi:MAG: bifunctional 4-hydroxy-2-oxoglutarate aldolase/2-dehydro-3-deoxy-phosphogluconate aldolase [Clostridia bacterium]
MNKQEFKKILEKESLVVVVRGNSLEQAFQTVEACYKGGIKLMEVTFTVPNAEKLLAKIADKYKGTDLVLGAGTVMNVQTAKLALANGASYIVSPNLNIKLQEYLESIDVAYTPGILTPTEAALAMEGGANVLKLFPGNIAQPSGLKALKGPYLNIEIMPTGGVSYENLSEWFSAGAIAVGAGSNLTAKAKTNDFDGVACDAKKWVARIKEIKEN